MKRITRLFYYGLLVGIPLLLGNGLASAADIITLEPAEMRGLRSSPSNPDEVFLLDFGAVKLGEDRTFAHFNVASIPSQIVSATLNVGIQNIDGGPPDGRIDVYSFAGDGTESLDEWAAGTLFHSFTGIEGGYSTLSVDITPLAKTAILADSSYLSFGFRTTEDDRFWLNSTIDGVTRSISGEPPTTITIAVVPEPETYAMLLAGLGLIGFIARRKQIN